MKKDSPEELSIMLVDDEPKVINGLERKIGLIEDGWDINVAYSGSEALEMLDDDDVDVVISDLRMPGMDGAELLSKTKSKHPDSLRFILSGYADQDLMIKATGVAHRYLTKPCDSQELVDAIRQVYDTRSLMSDMGIIRFVNETGELHVNNKPLQELLDLTNDPQCDVDELSKLIELQPTVHASVLHVANTAFFGAGGQIDTVGEALQRLGIEYVKSLAIMELSKKQIELEPVHMMMVDSVLKHCVETSQFALQMKPMIKNVKLIQTLSSLSLLHDLGKIVFLAHRKDEYARLWQISVKENRPLWALEREEFGCDHAGIGAYLFDLWGLPEALIRGVAWHHQPLKVVKDYFCPVSLLHMANYGAHKIREVSSYCFGDLDEELSRRFSVSPHFHVELN